MDAGVGGTVVRRRPVATYGDGGGETQTEARETRRHGRTHQRTDGVDGGVDGFGHSSDDGFTPGDGGLGSGIRDGAVRTARRGGAFGQRRSGRLLSCPARSDTTTNGSQSGCGAARHCR
jgi:hypothetical protein